MIIADVYYSSSFQQFIRDNDLGHPKYAWGVNFRRLAAEAYRAEDGLSRSYLLIDGEKVKMAAANVKLIKEIENVLTIRDDYNGSTYYHAIELSYCLDTMIPNKPSIIKTFISKLRSVNDIPRVDLNEDIFADSIEDIFNNHVNSKNETIENLEKTIETLQAEKMSIIEKYSMDIQNLIADHKKSMTRLEERIKGLRGETISIEKKMKTIALMYRDKARLSGWYVYEIKSYTTGMTFRGGSITIEEESYFLDSEVYYYSNDPDDRFSDNYLKIIDKLPPIVADNIEKDRRVIKTTIPRRVGGVIIIMSPSSFLSTHHPGWLVKSKIDDSSEY